WAMWRRAVAEGRRAGVGPARGLGRRPHRPRAPRPGARRGSRAPRGDGAAANAGLSRALAADLGLAGFDPLDLDRAAEAWTGPTPLGAWRTTAQAIEAVEDLAERVVAGDAPCDPAWTRTRAVLGWIDSDLAPAVDSCGAAEIAALLRGLDGRFVPPGPSGAPTRGRPDALPTGRNFFALDPRAAPTSAAWALGWASAQALCERHAREQGDFLRAIALSAWGTANMRTGGDDVAQALALIGARPVWAAESGRVTGYEILPLDLLGRPRVDVTLRVSGFFRDAFPAQIDLLDRAIRAVGAPDEPADGNPIAARMAEDRTTLAAAGDADPARAAGRRIFSTPPGTYGAGLQALIDASAWEDQGDLAEGFLSWGGYAYGAEEDGAPDRAGLERRLGRIDAVVHNQDNREHDLLDSDDYYQFEGGLAAAATVLRGGQGPASYHNDHSRPETPRIRTLSEEIGRTVRARCANPKWIDGVMRHGWKGAFEIAATVDYLFAFAATTDAVGDHHFDALYTAYIADDRVRGFMADANPDALRETAARFREALDRGLWRPRANDVHDGLAALLETP
ncbi:MAG: cobaltochelatase subunit CobN, partial [Pseudomonadota bacterium]